MAPQDLNHTFTALIGVNVKGQMWPCVEMLASRTADRRAWSFVETA
jgi:hypothetical protein